MRFDRSVLRDCSASLDVGSGKGVGEVEEEERSSMGGREEGGMMEVEAGDVRIWKRTKVTRGVIGTREVSFWSYTRKLVKDMKERDSHSRDPSPSHRSMSLQSSTRTS